MHGLIAPYLGTSPPRSASPRPASPNRRGQTRQWPQSGPGPEAGGCTSPPRRNATFSGDEPLCGAVAQGLKVLPGAGAHAVPVMVCLGAQGGLGS